MTEAFRRANGDRAPVVRLVDRALDQLKEHHEALAVRDLLRAHRSELRRIRDIADAADLQAEEVERALDQWLRQSSLTTALGGIRRGRRNDGIYGGES